MQFDVLRDLKSSISNRLGMEFQSHVQSSEAAALARETPRMLSDLGIPFPNWHVLLSRRQLGAT